MRKPSAKRVAKYTAMPPTEGRTGGSPFQRRRRAAQGVRSDAEVDARAENHHGDEELAGKLAPAAGADGPAHAQATIEQSGIDACSQADRKGQTRVLRLTDEDEGSRWNW